MSASMKRAMAEAHLSIVQRHVDAGAACLTRQRALIARLKGRGISSATAEHLLVSFLRLQALHVDHRDRLRAELSN